MKIVIALLVALTLSTTTLLAKEVFVLGCTTDHKTVATVVNVNDEIQKTHPAEEHIKAAFAAAAATMTAEQFLGEPGFTTFASGIDETDFTAIDGLEAPKVVGDCKQ